MKDYYKKVTPTLAVFISSFSMKPSICLSYAEHSASGSTTVINYLTNDDVNLLIDKLKEAQIVLTDTKE